METGLSQREDSVPFPLPAWIPPRKSAKDLATGHTAPRSHGREMLEPLPQAVLLSDGGMKVERQTETEIKR